MIFKPLPTEIIVNGVNYPIKTDFRYWVKFEQTINKYCETEDERLKNLCSAICEVMQDDIPKDISETLNAILNFYSCTNDWKTVKKPKSYGNTQTFDYEYDSAYIYAAFKEQYNIDLQDIEYLHWHKFKAMFKALKSDCKLIEIIGYRSMKIDPKLPRTQKEFYNEMKRIYALPTDENLIEIVKRKREEYNKANR